MSPWRKKSALELLPSLCFGYYPVMSRRYDKNLLPKAMQLRRGEFGKKGQATCFMSGNCASAVVFCFHDDGSVHA